MDKLRKRVLVSGLVLGIACALLDPRPANAQQIGGLVTDSTGAVLPGVTVEARSPAIIEQVRTVFTDGNGRYLLVALEPGAYTVTFTLTGFGTHVREGIELRSGFTANINASLSVADVAETITVSGATPVVDIASTQQNLVIDRKVVEGLPTGKAVVNYGMLIPGMGINTIGSSANVTQDSGGLTSSSMSRLAIHGGAIGDQVLNINDLDVGEIITDGSNLAIFPDTNFEEIAFSYAAQPATTDAGGVYINMIPKEGGNRPSGMVYSDFTLKSLHAVNLDENLIARGLRSGTRVDENWTISPSLGGALKKDRIWYFLAYYHKVADLQAPGVFYAVDPAALVFRPDFNKPALGVDGGYERSLNLTFQLTSKDKVKAYWSNSGFLHPGFGQSATTAPEASLNAEMKANVYQLTWVRPQTSRLLFKVGASHMPTRWFLGTMPTAVTRLPGVLELSTNQTSRNMSANRGATNYRSAPKTVNNFVASTNYVTGSHSLQVGFSWLEQESGFTDTSDNDYTGIATFNGAPTRASFFGPQFWVNEAKPTAALYAQERWTINRLTLNAGLRWEYVKAGYPDEVRPGNKWVQEFTIPGKTVVTWKDIMPRFGVAYDVFGTGKTALKASASRYGERNGTNFPELVNPALANRVQTRGWNDGLTGCLGTGCIPGDGLPQGDPRNPAPNGELLTPNTNLAFGVPIVTTFFDPAWAFGWRLKPSNWEISVGAQHALTTGMSVDFAYFRRIQVNRHVVDNRALGPNDFDIGTVTVPTDPRLPGGGGNTLTFLDLKPTSVRLADDVRTSSNNFGGETAMWNGFDLLTRVRRANVLLQGGLSSGRTQGNYCNLQSQLPESVRVRGAGADTVPLEFCSNTQNWLTQVKFLGSYGLPYGVELSGTLQNQPGPLRGARIRFTQTSLNRPLLLYPGGVLLDVVRPGTFWGERFNQIDFRVTKSFPFGGTKRLRAMFDLYNVLNSNNVTREQPAFGASWLAPLSIIPGRLAKFAFNFDF